MKIEEEKTSRYPSDQGGYAILTDESEMPYGRHKGKKMKDVPAKDLIWLAENDRCSRSVRAYVTDNWDALKKESGARGRSAR